jgi:hypothetical protein
LLAQSFEDTDLIRDPVDALPSLRVQLTIIDSFRVTQELLQKQQGYFQDGYPAMPLGTWYVLEGWLSSESRAPAIGSRVSVVTPSGESIECQLAQPSQLMANFG